MGKYTYEQRLRTILDVVEKDISFRTEAKQLGCDKSMVHR